MKRVLIAGVGNLLRGDDGVGLHVLKELEARIGARPDVRLYESGIAGVALVQELLEGYTALILLDALDRGASPGTVFVLEPERADAAPEAVDLHQADPEGVLKMASAMGVRPERVFIVGCQIAECDELTQELTEPVRRAVPEMVREVLALLAELAPEGTGEGGADEAEILAIDETLQVMYWLRGEAIAPAVRAEELSRWLALGPEAIPRLLARMEKLGLVEHREDLYRLTDRGVQEGGRRFSDEFSDLTRPGHGECGDPDCECRRSGDPADCRNPVR